MYKILQSIKNNFHFAKFERDLLFLFICFYSRIFIKTHYWVPLSFLWLLRIKLDNVLDKWFKINKEKKKRYRIFFKSPFLNKTQLAGEIAVKNVKHKAALKCDFDFDLVCCMLVKGAFIQGGNDSEKGCRCALAHASSFLWASLARVGHKTSP